MSASYVPGQSQALPISRTEPIAIVSVICEHGRVTKPTLRSVMDVAGISKSYAWDILNDKQDPSRPLAVFLLRQTGWRHPSIADLTDEQLVASEVLEPWVAPRERAA